MKKVTLAILSATLYLILFHISPYIGIPYEIILMMLLFSPFMIVSMVYFVLKYGKPSKYTFEERFYDDWDYTRM